MKKMLTQIFRMDRIRSFSFFLVLLVVPVSIISTANLYAGQDLQQGKKKITGQVVEGLTGNPLPGVSIMFKGKTTGTVTDIDGNFTLMAAPEDVLVFNFMGYLTEEVTVGEQTVINVTLAEDVIGLDEVVVTGYGVQKKSDVTGSIASVSSAQLKEIPVSGVDQALQGRAAGVNIISKSGRPGENTTIQIRGITSLNQSEPLVIVDGIAYGSSILSDISSSDIESVEVLKDASSAAIYGASGGNGVIIITTKKGQSGKMITDFNFYIGREVPIGKLELMNSQEYMQVAHENKYRPDEEDSWVAYTGRPDTLPTYDWQDYVFQPSTSKNYDISFRGGSEKSSFLISGSYNKQDGIIRNSDYSRATFRINSEHKITKRITIDEKAFFVNSIQEGFNDNLWYQYYDGPIRPAFQMAPFVPDYIADSNGVKKWANAIDFGSIPSTADNPLAKLDIIDRTERNNMFEANVGIKLEIIKGLSFTSRVDGRISFYDYKEYQPVYYNTTYDRRSANEANLQMGITKSMTYIAQQMLNYNFTLANAHNVSILAGLEANQNWGNNIYGSRYNMPSDNPNLLYFDVSENDTLASQIINGTGYKDRAMAYFGRINYDYKGKYLLTFNIRRDGRSSFGPDYRFGVFPSVSFGWKFTEEAFMKNQDFITFGKLRYGYGESGAYPVTGGTPYQSLVRRTQFFSYSFNNQSSLLGGTPVQIENPELRWEAVTTQNYGIDLAMLRNKFTLSLEYYSKINKGMIVVQDVPYVSGTYQMSSGYEGNDNASPVVNLGSIKNSGIEVTLGYRKMEGDLKGSFDLNFSTLKNEVLELAADSMQSGSLHSFSPITLTREGGSISDFWGWETDGIFRAEEPRNADGVYINQPYYVKQNGDTAWSQLTAVAGDIRFIDKKTAAHPNGDGKVKTNEDKVILGSPIPKLVFGFSINLEYKGFDMSAFFNGTYGNKILNGTKQYLYYYQGTTNHCKDFANRYVENDIVMTDPVTGAEFIAVPQNRNTTLFRNSSANYANMIDFYIEDGSYLRLRNLTLGYTLPKDLTKKVNIEKLRVYIGGKNLLTFTKYTGINPEAGFSLDASGGNLVMGVDQGLYPVTKTYMVGANVTF